ncbi:hypothetical protein FHG87_010830 [Trinorchestia longiramus]|nr:hypothetical protein FHG87_010830 [Trinorchestia longiramus]
MTNDSRVVSTLLIAFTLSTYPPLLYLLSTERADDAAGYSIVSQNGPSRPPGGVEEMQGGGRRVRLEWGAYITV